jgi:hypothetical protein
LSQETATPIAIDEKQCSAYFTKKKKKDGEAANSDDG